MNTAIAPQTVSVIGLGMMGAALAEALLNAGHNVTVWNRSPGKAGALTEKGAQVAASPKAALTASDVTIICVSDHAATMEILATVEPGAAASDKSLVQLSSMTADQSRETSAWAAARGIGYLEGSVFGLPRNVLEQTTMILTSGPRPVYDAAEPVLQAFGEALHLSPETGAAVSFDRVYYAWVYGSWLAFIQGAAMAHAKGFSVEAYNRIVLARCSVMPDRLGFLGRLIAERAHDEVECRLDVHAAAFAGTLAMCRETGVDDVLPAALMQNFERAIAAGHGDKEITAIFETLIDGVGAPS
jgi:3-hydroxyisobutyrate dehydrogenase-like beta-hydroxyacid dehydrogenase